MIVALTCIKSGGELFHMSMLGRMGRRGTGGTDCNCKSFDVVEIRLLRRSHGFR